MTLRWYPVEESGGQYFVNVVASGLAWKAQEEKKNEHYCVNVDALEEEK